MIQGPRKPLRVAFVDYIVEPDKPGRSGLSDIVWDMASELVHLGHDVHVIASYQQQRYPDERVNVHDFATPPMGYRNVVGHFLLLRRAADIARHIKPDIIHTPEYVSTAVFATLNVPAPLILTVPGNIFERIRRGHNYEWYYVQILKWAARTSARRCARIIAISSEMKAWWEWTGSRSDSTIWIPLGANEHRFHPLPGARQRLGISPDRLFFLYVGRFAREKGLLDLVDALARIKPRLPDQHVDVVLVGKGPQEDEIRRRIATEGLDQIIRLEPWVAQDDLATWYSAADAVVLPSRSEGFGRVISEAMSCGTPIIGSRIAGAEDHVQDNINGVLFPAGNSRALAEVLQRVLTNPALLRSMRQTTHAYAQEHLTWRHVVERVDTEVYQPLLGAAT